MAFLDFLFGSKDKTNKLPTMSQEQQDLLNQILSSLGMEGGLGEGNEQALQQLMELLDPSSAAQQRFAQPYLQQFNEQTIPGIAERFAGAGAQGGALSSSGFGQALGSAASGLQTQLAGLKSGLQQNALKDIMGQYQNLSQLGLGQKPFGYQYQQGSPGFFGALGGGLGGGLGLGLGNKLGKLF